MMWALAGASSAQAWAWPAEGDLLREFSVGNDPYSAGQHRGIDIALGDARVVRAPASGEVTFAGQVPTHGLTVTIATADGYKASLTHLGPLLVDRGQHVGEGDPVAETGPSGTPEHDVPYVHLGIRVGETDEYIDPLKVLPERTAPAPPPEPAPAAAPPVVSPAPAPAPEPAPAPAPEPAPSPAPAPIVAEAPSPPPAVASPPAEAPVPNEAPASETPAPVPVTTAQESNAESSTEVGAPATVTAEPVSIRPDVQVVGEAVRKATRESAAAITGARNAQAPKLRTGGGAPTVERGVRSGTTTRGGSASHAVRSTSPALGPDSAARDPGSMNGAGNPGAEFRAANDAQDSSFAADPASGPWSVLLVVAALAALALLGGAGLCAIRVARRRLLIIDGRERARAEEDSRGGCVAVRERTASHWPRGGVRSSVGYVRALPPAQGERCADGERHRRAWHPSHGRGRRRRRVSA